MGRRWGDDGETTGRRRGDGRRAFSWLSCEPERERAPRGLSSALGGDRDEFERGQIGTRWSGDTAPED